MKCNDKHNRHSRYDVQRHWITAHSIIVVRHCHEEEEEEEECLLWLLPTEIARMIGEYLIMPPWRHLKEHEYGLPLGSTLNIH